MYQLWSHTWIKRCQEGYGLKKNLMAVLQKLSRKKRFWMILFIAGVAAFIVFMALLIFQAENMRYVVLLVLFLLFGIFVYKILRLDKIFPDSYPTIHMEIVNEGQKATAKVKMHKDFFRCGRNPLENDYILNIPWISGQQFWIEREFKENGFVYKLSDRSDGLTYYVDHNNGDHTEIFSEKILQQNDEQNQFVIGCMGENYVRLKICLPR